MPYSFGAASKKEMTGIHPFLYDVNMVAITVSEQDFSCHDGLRTEAEQRRLVGRGASKTMNSKHRMQADGFGHAVDNVPYINGKLRWEWKPIYVIAAAMMQAVQKVNAARAAKGLSEHVLTWGAVWDRPFTPEHFGTTPESMERAVNAYVDRRRAAGKSAFIDGPHWELRA